MTEHSSEVAQLQAILGYSSDSCVKMILRNAGTIHSSQDGNFTQENVILTYYFDMVRNIHTIYFF